MTDEEKAKSMLDELFKQVVKDVTQNIERARKENQETKKMQDFIIEKMTVEVSFMGRYPKPSWINEAIDHYISLGARTSRNDIMTRLTEEMTRLKEIKDPKEIEEIGKRYREHEKEVMNLIKPHIVGVAKPRF